MQVENLKAYLANIGMTIVEFSELLDCDPSYISRIMRGKTTPSRRLARDIRLATDGIINFKTRDWEKKEDLPQEIVA